MRIRQLPIQSLPSAMMPSFILSITALRMALTLLAMVGSTSAAVLPTAALVVDANELIPLPTFVLAPPALTSPLTSTPSSISTSLPYEPSTIIVITKVPVPISEPASTPAPTPTHIHNITSPRTGDDLFSSEPQPNNHNLLASPHTSRESTWPPYAVSVSWIILCVDLVLFIGLWFLYAVGCIDRRFTPTSRCYGLRGTRGRRDYLATPREIRSIRAEREWWDRREMAVYGGELRSPRERVEGLEGEMRRLGML